MLAKPPSSKTCSGAVQRRGEWSSRDLLPDLTVTASSDDSAAILLGSTSSPCLCFPRCLDRYRSLDAAAVSPGHRPRTASAASVTGGHTGLRRRECENAPPNAGVRGSSSSHAENRCCCCACCAMSVVCCRLRRSSAAVCSAMRCQSACAPLPLCAGHYSANEQRVDQHHANMLFWVALTLSSRSSANAVPCWFACPPRRLPHVNQQEMIRKLLARVPISVPNPKTGPAIQEAVPCSSHVTCTSQALRSTEAPPQQNTSLHHGPLR